MYTDSVCMYETYTISILLFYLVHYYIIPSTILTNQLSIIFYIHIGDDGGSCIDGRLTSAWNWCSKLHKKPYYYVFMFTGFQGFDGDWKAN